VNVATKSPRVSEIRSQPGQPFLVYSLILGTSATITDGISHILGCSDDYSGHH